MLGIPFQGWLCAFILALLACTDFLGISTIITSFLVPQNIWFFGKCMRERAERV